MITFEDLVTFAKTHEHTDETEVEFMQMVQAYSEQQFPYKRKTFRLWLNATIVRDVRAIVYEDYYDVGEYPL